MKDRAASNARRISWFVGISVLLVFIFFGRLNGTRIVGFRYGVFVNNEETFCPERVVSQVGRTITLATGRSLTLDAGHRDLAGELGASDNRIFIDEESGLVYGRYRCAYCSFDNPTRSQMFTIPLFRKDMPAYQRQIIARYLGSQRASSQHDPRRE